MTDFASAAIPATKESTGLTGDDGKHPDGMTLVSWQLGKPLTWDVTVAHTQWLTYMSAALHVHQAQQLN